MGVVNHFTIDRERLGIVIGWVLYMSLKERLMFGWCFLDDLRALLIVLLLIVRLLLVY